MTGNQFDSVMSTLLNVVERQEKLIELVNKQNEILTTLANKTVVINAVDKELEALRLDIKSLRDEQEM